MNLKRTLYLRVFLLSLSLFSVVSPIYAKGPGERLGDALTKNLNALIPGVLLLIGIYFLVVRDWMKMISFFAIALFVAIFTNWTWVTELAKKIYNSFLI